MNILSLCSNPDLLSVIRIINIVILIIKIAVPIILIVIISFDITSAIKAGDEDLLKKQMQGVVRKLIAAVVIFLIPSFTNLIIKIADPDNVYVSCMNDATVEGIQEAYIFKASELVLKAEETKSYTDYGKAKAYITNIDDESVYSDFEKRLDAVYLIIQENIKKEDEKTNTSDGDINNTVKGKYVSPVKETPGGYYGTQNNTYCTYKNATQSIIHDLMLNEGTSVYASFDGTAVFSQGYCVVSGKSYLWSYGNKVQITGNNGEGIVIGHLSSFVINGQTTKGNIVASCNSSFSNCGAGDCSSGTKYTTVGTQTVKAGDLIGYTGNTGNSGAPHLHVELKNPNGGGCAVDPWSDYFGLK